MARFRDHLVHSPEGQDNVEPLPSVERRKPALVRPAGITSPLPKAGMIPADIGSMQ